MDVCETGDVKGWCCLLLLESSFLSKPVKGMCETGEVQGWCRVVLPVVAGSCFVSPPV